VICLHVRFHSVRFTLFQFQHTLVWRVVLQAADSIRQNVTVEISFVWTFEGFIRIIFLSYFLTFLVPLVFITASIFYLLPILSLLTSIFSRSQYKLCSFSFSIYSFIFAYSYFLSFQDFFWLCSTSLNYFILSVISWRCLPKLYIVDEWIVKDSVRSIVP
jgi:hypothetical protein